MCSTFIFFHIAIVKSATHLFFLKCVSLSHHKTNGKMKLNIVVAMNYYYEQELCSISNNTYTNFVIQR